MTHWLPRREGAVVTVWRKDSTRIVTILLLICLAAWLPARHVEAREEVADLLSLSIEELMEIELTSVAQRTQRLSGTAAPAGVLTGEDIRRSRDKRIERRLRSGNE